MVRSAVLGLVFLVTMLAAATAFASTNDDSLFEKGLKAARNDDWQALARIEQQLPKDHPLRAYLDFHKLRGTLPQLDPKRIQAFAKRYPDSPLPDDIRQLALVAYAKAKRWPAARTLYDSPPGPTALRCYYLQARLPVDRQDVLKKARLIWLSGQSLPPSCNPLFTAARHDGVIGEDEIWQRMRLAFRDRSTGLMRYLLPMLDAHKQAAQWLLKLYRDPGQVDKLPATIGAPQRQQLIALALRRMADTDTVEARKRLENAGQTLGFTDPALRQKVARRIAWYSIIRDVDDNMTWVDSWLANSDAPNLVDQRARLAITQQNWQALPAWIQRLPDQDRRDSRWLYWGARAASENGNDGKARKLWEQAAQQRNFYGFLAADKLGQPYQFSNVEAEPDKKVQTPVLARIAILRRIDEWQLAWNEWNWLLWHSSEQQNRALAAQALNRGWDDLAVQASIQARAWDKLAWRFPSPHKAQFQEAGHRYHVDPWLAMAVARRESAYYPQAQSQVGAMGLMQLIPSTARKVSKQAGQTPPGPGQLTKPAVNIALGTHYLGELLQRFNGNRVLALAAYNAGPHRVEQWLADDQDKSLPADVWIESIPFHETRDYVQAVLTYRVLLIGLHAPSQQTAQLLNHHEAHTPYSVAMIDGGVKLPTE